MASERLDKAKQRTAEIVRRMNDLIVKASENGLTGRLSVSVDFLQGGVVCVEVDTKEKQLFR